MTDILQHAINGLVSGSVIALVAIGVTLIFGLTGLVFFAHGEVLMLGGFVAWLSLANGVPLALALVAPIVAMGVFGFVIERGVFQWTYDRPVNGFVASLGLIIILQHAALAVAGGNPRRVVAPFVGVVEFGGVRISWARLVVIGVTAALVLLIYLVLAKTKWGFALRAAAEDRELASLSGIPVRRYFILVFIVGCASAGLAGALLLLIMPVTPFVGATVIIKAFAVAIIGGLGNVGGALIAGLGLGIIESFGTAYLAAEWAPAYAFIAMIVVLLWRPQGILRGTAGASLAVGTE